MPCWKNTSPADWVTVTERSDVHAERIEAKVWHGFATGEYQCKIGVKYFGEFISNESTHSIPDSFEMGPKYIFNSLYKFIWTTVGPSFWKLDVDHSANTDRNELSFSGSCY